MILWLWMISEKSTSRGWGVTRCSLLVDSSHHPAALKFTSALLPAPLY